MSYYQSKRISQSYLKGLLKNGFVKKEEDTSKYLMGSLVDMMLTEPEALDNVYVVDASTPTGKKKIFAQHIIDHYDPVYNDLATIVEEAYSVAEYKNKSPMAYYADIHQDPWFIMQLEIKNNPDALVADRKTFDQAHLVAASLTAASPEVSEIVNNANHRQLEIYWDAIVQDKVFECKSKLDLVIETDTDVYPYDIKTTRRGTNNFIKDIIEYRYDIQAYFYRLACQALFSDKTVHPMKFIVESHVYPGEPRIYDIHSSLNELRAMTDIKRGLMLADIYERTGRLLPVEVGINNLWEQEPLDILLDKLISSQGLEMYYRNIFQIESEISTLELVNQK